LRKIRRHGALNWLLQETSQPAKKRLYVDYSQTVNKFTYLDAYPLPRVDDSKMLLLRFNVPSTPSLFKTTAKVLLHI